MACLKQRCLEKNREIKSRISQTNQGDVVSTEYPKSAAPLADIPDTCQASARFRQAEVSRCEPWKRAEGYWAQHIQPI